MEQRPVDPAAGAATQAPDAPKFVLESGKRLSESFVWRLQRDSYTRQEQRAWTSDHVPFYITSNTYIAAAYAKVVLGFMRDALAAGRLEREAPFYVLELASGPGQFAFLFLKKMLPLLQREPELAGVRFRYVMSDLVSGNVQAWQQREALKPFMDAGVLDFAGFDIEHDDELRLARSGETLSAKTLRNPLAVIANYTFDTTAQDAFFVRQGVLQEALVTVFSSQREPEGPPQPELFRRIGTSYERRPLQGRYYEDELMERVLRSYAGRLGDTALLFPVGALRGIRALIGISNGRLLLLSGDKGYAHEDELIGRGEPQMAVHAGQCFSMMVNYHAIGLYFRERGGLALHASTRDKRLKVSAFVLGGEGEAAFPQTTAAYATAVDGFGPCEYFVLVAGIRKELPTASLELILSLLKLSEWDPHVVYSLSGTIAEHARKAPEYQRHDLMRALEKCWENFYPMDQDVPFEMARIYGALERPLDALRFYKESLKRYKEHQATLFNAGLCFYRLQQPREALALMERALQLKGDYAPARDWRLRIQAELAGA